MPRRVLKVFQRFDKPAVVIFRVDFTHS
jgi:hypothetical protein